MDLKPASHIHFLGIGGIGMSGQAILAAKRGFQVSGCDVGISAATLQRLKEAGVTFMGEHAEGHLLGVDLVVYSTAISHSLDEFVAARAAKIPMMHRAKLLAWLMRDYSHRIAISGAHGKTTTTSLVTWILHASNHKPTAMVGGVIAGLGSAVIGGQEYFVLEADESDRSFLHYSPTTVVVTNIDAEHLDVYQDLDDIKQTFLTFIANTGPQGSAVLCVDDGNVRDILPSVGTHTITYGIGGEYRPDLLGHNVDCGPTVSTFSVSVEPSLAAKFGVGTQLGPFSMPLAGLHYVRNALAAIAVALIARVPVAAVEQALSTFPGIGRRFEFKGRWQGADVFDDYGHHPTEIRATLTAALNRTRGRLFVVFQPHRYTRTKLLFREFVELFQQLTVHQLFILDIYAASEQPLSLSSQELVQSVGCPHVAYASSREALIASLRQTLQPGDLLLTIGAGDVYKVGELVVAEHT